MNNKLLDVQNISFSYGKNKILDNISFSAERGEFISVIGRNGCGKTTLFKILSSALKYNSGNIKINNIEISSMKPSQRASLIAIVQQSESTDFPFTCYEVIKMGLNPYQDIFGRITSEQQSEIIEAMKMTDTFEFADKHITDISGGELQRVLIARAIVQKPDIMLLDEAMSDLDVNAKLNITELLKNLSQKNNFTVISINHDHNSVYRFSSRVIVIDEGKIYSDGTPDTVFTPQMFKDVFKVNAEIIRNKGVFVF